MSRFFHHASKCAVIPLLIAVIASCTSAQDDAANTAPPDNESSVDSQESPQFNTTEDDATTRAVEIGTNSYDSAQGDSAESGDEEFNSADRDAADDSQEQETSSYLDELAEKYSDPAFDKYVNFSQLQAAFAADDASVLVDVILELAHAEKILQREHRSGVTAADLVKRLSKFLAKSEKPEFERLKRAAENLGKKTWKEQLASASEFTSKERSPAPSVSLDKLSSEQLAAYMGFSQALRGAEMTGNAEDTRSILDELAKSNLLSDDEKEFLSQSRSPLDPEDKDDAASELLREFSSASRDSSNRNEVRAGLSRGWSVVWGKNFTEADWARGLASLAQCVAEESPRPFLKWFSDVLNENFRKIERNLPGVVRADLLRWVLQSIKGKTIVRYRDFRIQAGFATYDRWQSVIYHEPYTKKVKKKLPFGGWTWGFETGMAKKERRVNLPNWHQFYVRYQLVPSSRPTPRPPSPSTSKIWIENTTTTSLNYKINGKNFSINRGSTRWHSRSGSINVEFDYSFASGYQRKSYNLTPGSRNFFKRVGNGIDLYKR